MSRFDSYTQKDPGGATVVIGGNRNADGTITPGSSSITIDGWGDRVRTAFDRLKVDTQKSIISAFHTGQTYPLFWTDGEVSGSGTTSSYVSADVLQRIGVTAAVGKRARQTVARGNYEPGKGLTILMSVGNFGASSADISKRIGYFDDNNGLFWHANNDSLSLGVRKGGSDTDIPQANWNGNKLDETDPANPINYTAAMLAKSNIFWIDMEWLGVGTVRFGTVYNGQIVLCHSQHHATLIDGVYMASPNLPVRYEIENTGTTDSDTLDVICCAINSEGGTDKLGVSRFIPNFAGRTLGTAGSWYPFMSVRLNPSYDGATIIPLDISISASSANANFNWAVLFNDPDNSFIGGTDAVSWQSVSNSSIQYDISRDNTNIVTFDYGKALLGGSAATSDRTSNRNMEINWYLGKKIDGTPFEYVIAIYPLSTSTVVFGGIDFRELS